MDSLKRGWNNLKQTTGFTPPPVVEQKSLIDMDLNTKYLLIVSILVIYYWMLVQSQESFATITVPTGANMSTIVAARDAQYSTMVANAGTVSADIDSYNGIISTLQGMYNAPTVPSSDAVNAQFASLAVASTKVGSDTAIYNDQMNTVNNWNSAILSARAAGLK